MKKTTKPDVGLHAEHQALISYLTSKASPSEAAKALYSVLLLASAKAAPDIFTTMRYCLEDARISGKLETLLRQKAEIIKRDYSWFTDDHADVKYTLGSRTVYDDDDCERAIKILDAVNDFYTVEGTLGHVTHRNPVAIDSAVLDGLPLVIRRLDSKNPAGCLSRSAAPQLKGLIERSTALPETEFINRHL